MTERSVAPPGGEDLFDKYARGLRIIAEGAQIDTGQTPKGVVWSRNTAKLYHYQTEKEKTVGVGLLNVQRRLQLLYPDAHDLIITQDAQTFRVHLKLRITDEDKS